MPDAYSYAPSAVSSFLSATGTKISIFVLISIYYKIFGESLIFQKLPLPQFLLTLSLFAMFVPNFITIFQNKLKRLFAYSSVGQIGYITLGVSFDSIHGLAASILHLFNHALAKGAIFLLIGGIIARQTNRPGHPPAPAFERLAGLSRHMPVTTLGIVMCGLSLIGVPGTAGFISKWHLILAAIEKGQWWLVGAILLSSLLAVLYVWRFIETAYLRDPPPGLPLHGEASLALQIPAWILIAATIWFGFDTTFALGSALDAARDLFYSSQ